MQYTDEELQAYVPHLVALNIGKISRWEVVEWMKYEAITGCFPNMRLILKLRGGVIGQNKYTVDKMLEEMSGPEEDHY